MGQRSDISTVMNGFDLLVLSSVTEAFPNVLNEAMACGTPCATTDVGDAALIVGKTGWVVPSQDSQILAEAIMQAIEEKKIMLSLGWCEKKRVELVLYRSL